MSLLFYPFWAKVPFLSPPPHPEILLCYDFVVKGMKKTLTWNQLINSSASKAESKVEQSSKLKFQIWKFTALIHCIWSAK